MINNVNVVCSNIKIATEIKVQIFFKSIIIVLFLS